MPEPKIVWTVGGLSRRHLKKGEKKLTRKVMKDKKYRRALKKADVRDRKLAKKVTQAAVGSMMRHHEVVEKRPSALLLQAELLARLAGNAKEAAKITKKREKTRAKKLVLKWKKRGARYDKKTGLVRLLKAEKLPKLKKVKPYRPKKK